MKILYCGPKFDYGLKNSGFSMEHRVFYDTLTKFDNSRHEVYYYPFDEKLKELGYKKMQSDLIDFAEQNKPDVFFSIFFQDEVAIETLRSLKRLEITTMNWFCDDHWRFNNFSKYYAPVLDWVITTDKDSVERYKSLGQKNVVLSQWGYNHFINTPAKKSFQDISFIGKKYGKREMIVEKIKQEGFNVKCFGGGWNGGRLEYEEMLSEFNHSKINLNFTDSSGSWSKKRLAKIFLYKRLDQSYHLYPPNLIAEQIQSFKQSMASAQIKARFFEVTGAGGFLLSAKAPGIEDYFVPNKEIVLYSDIPDMLLKISYYLKNNDLREKITKAGNERVLKDHTMEKRFLDIFKTSGVL